MIKKTSSFKKAIAKKKGYMLASVPYVLGCVCLVYLAVGGITGAIGAGVCDMKRNKCITDFKNTAAFSERAKTDTEEIGRAFYAGEISQEDFDKKIEYFSSDEYAKEILEAEEDSKYTAILKTKEKFAIVFGTALLSAALATAGILCGYKIRTKYIEDHRYWDEDELEFKDSYERDKEARTLELIGTSDEEEELKQADF